MMHPDNSASFPIDVVYTWVDGSDAAWKEQFLQERAKISDSSVKRGGDDPSRFRNMEELKYSLRSLHTYLPFVRHIFIVTAGQKPDWLQEHPQITVVDHRQIFADPAHLPTFNSCAIESQLHRIPNLSEHFLYFNDDFFILKQLGPEKFFSSEGLPLFFFGETLATSGIATGPESAWRSGSRNTTNLIHRLFGTRNYYLFKHAPYALRKSLIEEVEKRFPEVFRQVASNKFRCQKDYMITNGLIQYYALNTNKGKNGEIRSIHFPFTPDPVVNIQFFNRMKSEKLDTFCVQDVNEEAEAPYATDLAELLESLYPHPAPWERAYK